MGTELEVWLVAGENVRWRGVLEEGDGWRSRRAVEGMVAGVCSGKVLILVWSVLCGHGVGCSGGA